VLGAEGGLGVGQVLHQAEEFLVIQPTIAHQMDEKLREERVADANSALDLPVLTDKVQRVAEPVSVGDNGNPQVGDRGGDRRIAAREAGGAIQGRRRAFVNRRDPSQMVRVGLLEIDRINGDHEHRGLFLITRL
jgi:hypothetical protein